MAFKLDMTVDLFMAYVLMLILMTLTLMQSHSESAKGKKSAFNYLDNKQASNMY